MTSSKTKIDDLLKAGGTLDTKITAITTELGTGQDKLGKLITDATAGQSLDFKDAYTKFETAITDANNIIDEALNSNDLTELDTSNLKALRSYINETKATFDTALKDSGLDATKANAAPKQEQLDKLQAGLDSSTGL